MPDRFAAAVPGTRRTWFGIVPRRMRARAASTTRTRTRARSEICAPSCGFARSACSIHTIATVTNETK